MFLVKSAFWLAIGFILVAPHGVDLGAGAQALKDKAVTAGLQAGQDLIVSQILTSEAPGKAVLARSSASFSSLDPTMQDSSSKGPIPVPQPRPDWMS